MPTAAVTVLAQLRLRPDSVKEGKRDLLEFARTVRRSEPECLSIDVVQDVDDPTTITLIEKWSDRAAYEGPHLQTKHMKAFIERSSKYFDGPANVSIGRATAIGREDYRRAPYAR